MHSGVGRECVRRLCGYEGVGVCGSGFGTAVPRVTFSLPRVGWSVDEAGMGLGEAPLSYGYGGTGKVVVNNRYNEYGEKYGPGDIIGCYLVSVTPVA